MVTLLVLGGFFGCTPDARVLGVRGAGADDAGDLDSAGDSSGDTSDIIDSAAGTGEPALGTLELHMIDVWQGDSIFVVAPSGKTMLVDAGDESDYWGLQQHIRETGLDIDYTVVSHQHADHMGGMDLVLLDHPEVVAAYDGNGIASSQSYEDYVAAAGDKRTPLLKGDMIDLGAGLFVEVLHSDIGDWENENNNSVVLKLTHGDITVLLGGDCESIVCERAIHPGPISVYKVHHHGSSDSTSAKLLEEMSPSIALIGVGAGNDYGHPDNTTISELTARGTTVYRTDLDGNIVVKSDGSTLSVEVGVP